MSRSLFLGGPVNTTLDARWDWIFRALKKVEDASHYEELATDLNLNGYDIVDADGNVLTPRIKLAADTTYYIGATPVTVTMTIASPCVVTMANHGLAAGTGVRFTTTGALPTGITQGLLYFVLATGLTEDEFQISLTAGGAAVNTSGSQSGVHSCVAGSDSNDGSAATSGTAWATIQHAWDWVAQNIDLGGYTLNIQFAEGWYNFKNDGTVALGAWQEDRDIAAGAYVQLIASPTGQGYVRFQGQPGDKAAVTLTTTAEIWATIEVDCTNAVVLFDDLTLRNDIAGAWGIIIGAYNYGGSVAFFDVDFNGTGGWTHIDAAGTTTSVSFSESYSITASGEVWNCHIAVGQACNASWANRTDPLSTEGPLVCTITGAPNFNVGFCYVAHNGFASVNGEGAGAPALGTLFDSDAVGNRFYIENGGCLAFWGGDISQFPGDNPGTVLEGGSLYIGGDGIVEGYNSISDDTPGSEDMTRHIRTMIGGALTNIASFGPGVQIGSPTGGDKGAGTLNLATALYINGADPLDSYDEGTWTPGMTFGGSSSGVTYSTQTGYYTKIGNVCIAYFYIALTSNGSGSGAARITGLPFTINGSDPSGGVTQNWYGSFTGLTGALVYDPDGNATTILMGQWSATGFSGLTETQVTDGAATIGCFVYPTA